MKSLGEVSGIGSCRGGHVEFDVYSLRVSSEDRKVMGMFILIYYKQRVINAMQPVIYWVISDIQSTDSK